jgi:hypothetical protein
LDTWEFFCACYAGPTAICTRWRWRRILDNGGSFESTIECVTLPQCKAEAAQHGFCVEDDAFSVVAPPYMGGERRFGLRALNRTATR